MSDEFNHGPPVRPDDPGNTDFFTKDMTDEELADWRWEQFGPPRAMVWAVVIGLLFWIAVGLIAWWLWPATPPVETAFLGEWR